MIELADFAAAKKSIETAAEETELQLSRLMAQSDEQNIQRTLQRAIRDTLTILTDPNATLQEKNNAARNILDTCTFDKANSSLVITYRTTL